MLGRKALWEFHAQMSERFILIDDDSLPSLLVCMKEQQHQLMTRPPHVQQ